MIVMLQCVFLRKKSALEFVETSEACFASGWLFRNSLDLKSTSNVRRKNGKNWLLFLESYSFLPKLFQERVYWHHLCTKFFKKLFVSSKFFREFVSLLIRLPDFGSVENIESFLARVGHVDNKRPAITTWLFGRIATWVRTWKTR